MVLQITRWNYVETEEFIINYIIDFTRNDILLFHMP